MPILSSCWFSLNDRDIQGFPLHQHPVASDGLQCAGGSTIAPWMPCAGGGGEGGPQAKSESVVPASAIAATCACARESEHWNQNRMEKQQLGEPQGGDDDRQQRLHGVLDGTVCEGLEQQAGAAPVKDSVPERKAFLWLSKMKSH